MRHGLIFAAGLIAGLALGGCSSQEEPCCPCREDRPLDQQLMLLLSSARSLHHQADLHLEQGEVDIILMDISLRGDEDGLQLTRRIRENPAYADLPIIAVTAHASAENRRMVLEAGCDDFITKPVPKVKLLEAIQRVVG